MKLLVVFIGIFASALNVWADDSEPAPGMVIVEPSDTVTTKVDDGYPLVPYLERRGRWGGTVSIGYNSYSPKNYLPNFSDESFDKTFSSAETPLLEVKMSVKRNVEFGSYGGELATGFYRNTSSTTAASPDSGATLQIIPLRLGGILSLDALGPEPYYVPYVSAGAYMLMFKDSIESSSFNGNTKLSSYATLGLALQLDRLDPKGSRSGYRDSGVQSTYLYLEISSFMASKAASDPDFGSTFNYGGGLTVEF